MKTEIKSKADIMKDYVAGKMGKNLNKTHSFNPNLPTLLISKKDPEKPLPPKRVYYKRPLA